MANTPVKILFSHYASDFGGGSDRALFDVVTHLPSERFHPYVVLRTHDPMADRYRQHGIDVDEMDFTPPRRSRNAGDIAKFALNTPPEVFHLKKIIEKHDVQVVHANTLFNLQTALAAAWAKRPLVWHVRELMPESLGYKALCGIAANRAQATIAVSSAVAQPLRRAGATPSVVFNSLDIASFDAALAAATDAPTLREELHLDPNAPFVAVVGRLEPWKGQAVLVEAVPAVLQAVPQAQFLFVGAPAFNKPEYAKQLVMRLRELGVENQCHFTGPRNDIPAVLADSAILVSTSVSPEPFGLTLLEGMAARRPVIATAAGGPLEIVLPGETGWLTPPGDSQQLAEKVIRLLTHPDEAATMGAAGRARVESFFDIAREVAALSEIFERLARPETAGAAKSEH